MELAASGAHGARRGAALAQASTARSCQLFVEDALGRLARQGWTVVVATDGPGPGRRMAQLLGDGDVPARIVDQLSEVGELGRAGCPRLDVICPGFVSDCLETLEEINQLNRETFTTAGGGSFHYIPWGNDSDGAIATLAQQARKVLAGWI